MENKIWMTGKEITETFGILASELWDACSDGNLKAYDDMRNDVEINFHNYCIKRMMNTYNNIDTIKELQDGRTYNTLKEEYRKIISDTLFKSDDIQTCFSHYFPKIVADIEKDAKIARLEQELASAKARIDELQAALANAVQCDGEGFVKLACDMRREGKTKKEIYDHLRNDGKWLSRPQASSIIYPHAVPVQDRTITKYGDRLR